MALLGPRKRMKRRTDFSLPTRPIVRPVDSPLRENDGADDWTRVAGSFHSNDGNRCYSRGREPFAHAHQLERFRLAWEAWTCYRGNRTPFQRRSFRAAIMGWAERDM